MSLVAIFILIYGYLSDLPSDQFISHNHNKFVFHICSKKKILKSSMAHFNALLSNGISSPNYDCKSKTT